MWPFQDIIDQPKKWVEIIVFGSVYVVLILTMPAIAYDEWKHQRNNREACNSIGGVYRHTGDTRSSGTCYRPGSEIWVRK